MYIQFIYESAFWDLQSCVLNTIIHCPLFGEPVIRESTVHNNSGRSGESDSPIFFGFELICVH